MAVVGEAQIVVRAITTGFQRQVQNSLRGINVQQAGTNVAQSFTRGFTRQLQNNLGMTNRQFRNMSTEATQAADAFKALVIQGYFLGPALAGAAGAIGSLAAGIVALGSQLAAALPSLVVLPGVLAAIAQAAIAVKLAFGGVGEALKAAGKQAGGSSKAQEAAARRIEDADRALFRVLERNRETLIRSARELEEAEDNLTKARERAREELQQLDFDAEDAAINQKKAAIELERARETLARVQDLPPNSRARREAELAFAEADLNLRRARDRNSDLAKEQDEAAKKGVEGSDRVVEATKRLREAEEAQARSVREGLRAQEDAFRDLERAKEDAAKAGSGAGGEDPFANISAAARRFVEFITALKPRFIELRKLIQEQFFPPFIEALDQLVTKYFPILEDFLPRTGKAAGETAKRFAEIVTQQRFLENFQDVGETNIYVIDRLGIVAGNLAAAFTAILDAAGPLIRRFTDWVVTITEAWKNTMEADNATGELTDTLNYAGDVAAQIGDVFGNLFDAIMNIGRAAAGPGSGGEMLLNMLEDVTKRFSEWTDKVNKDGSLAQYFRDTVPGFVAVGGLLKEIVIQFLRLGNDEGVAGFVDSLREAVINLGDMGEKFLEAGPVLGDFIVKFTEFLEKFAESGSIKVFFGILNEALDIAITIFSNENVAKAFGFVAAVTAIGKAGSVLGGIFSFAGKVLDGYITKGFQVATLIPGLGAKAKIMGINFAAAGGGLTGLSAALGVSAGTVALAAAGIFAFAAVIFLAYQKSEIFREAVSKLIDSVGGALKEAFNTILAAIQEVMPEIENWGDVFKEIGDYIGTYVVPVLEILLVGAIKEVGRMIAGLIRVVGGIINVFRSVWDFVRGFFALLSGDTKKATELFKSSFERLVSGLKLIFSGIKDIVFAPFRAAFNAISEAWNRTVGTLKWEVPGWIPVIGGKKVSAPQLPKLAMGGTVFPSPTGTLVQVAEAGRPERIEPLDPDGLSKRDKAIISMLSGGGTGGQTFNIYPAPGMDERELAALVSRQIAFQLRAGSV